MEGRRAAALPTLFDPIQNDLRRWLAGWPSLLVFSQLSTYSPLNDGVVPIRLELGNSPFGLDEQIRKHMRLLELCFPFCDSHVPNFDAPQGEPMKFLAPELNRTHQTNNERAI
jgi:hypothetical protein